MILQNRLASRELFRKKHLRTAWFYLLWCWPFPTYLCLLIKTVEVLKNVINIGKDDGWGWRYWNCTDVASEAGGEVCAQESTWKKFGPLVRLISREGCVCVCGGGDLKWSFLLCVSLGSQQILFNLFLNSSFKGQIKWQMYDSFHLFFPGFFHGIDDQSKWLSGAL